MEKEETVSDWLLTDQADVLRFLCKSICSLEMSLYFLGLLSDRCGFTFFHVLPKIFQVFPIVRVVSISPSALLNS